MAIDKRAVGKRLKAIQLVSGMDRKQYVARLAIGLADLNNYEDARMLVPVQTAAKMVELIPGLTLDWIFLARTAGLDPDLQGKLTAAEASAGKAA